MQKFNDFLLGAYIKMTNGVQNLMKKENGEANIIAVILVLAIVIALVVIFRKNIETIVNKIWGSIQGNIGDAVKDGGIGNSIS